MSYLIINADDFGYSPVFNKSIIKLAQEKLISSTSVMVNSITDEQKHQIDAIQQVEDLSIGLHLVFEEGDIDEQIEEQYNTFWEIFGMEPSHVDIHKPSNPEDTGKVIDFCKQNNLACRNLNFDDNEVITTDEKVFNGTDATEEEIIEWLKTLEDYKYYEILFHPGAYDKNCKSSLNIDRELDVEKISKIYPILEKNGIEVINFNELS